MVLREDARRVFEARVEATDGGYRLALPADAVDAADVEVGTVYRFALLDRRAGPGPTHADGPAPDHPQPPVEVGEIRYVEVTDLGKQGDGIARVERGYVLIVPGGEVGERVRVEVTEVRPTFALAEVLDGSFD